MLHLMRARGVARDLHTIAPGYLGARVADRSWRSEKIAICAFHCEHYYHYYYDWPISKQQSKSSQPTTTSAPLNLLVGLVVKASASRAEVPRFESRLQGNISGSSHNSDLKIGTPVATLLGAKRYRVSARTGWPSASILWLGEVESLICNFYLGVATLKMVWADPSLRYTSMLLGHLLVMNMQM